MQIIRTKTTTGSLVSAVAIDPEWSVNELLARYPAAASVLNAHGVDSCCGGASSLADAARAEQLDLATLLAALGKAVAGSTP